MEICVCMETNGESVRGCDGGLLIELPTVPRIGDSFEVELDSEANGYVHAEGIVDDVMWAFCETNGENRVWITVVVTVPAEQIEYRRPRV